MGHTIEVDNAINAAKRSLSLRGISENELRVWAERIVCIVGPSAVGKHTLCRQIVEKRPEQYLLLGPATTRACTTDDTEYNGYISVKPKQFDAMLEREDFLYWHIVSTASYGLEKRRIRDCVAAGKIILLTFRSTGAIALKVAMPRVTVVELRCSIETLSRRIRDRSRFRPEQWQSRIEVAPIELHTNGFMCEKYRRSPENRWFYIDNNDYGIPICNNTVEEALVMLDAEITKPASRSYLRGK